MLGARPLRGSGPPLPHSWQPDGRPGKGRCGPFWAPIRYRHFGSCSGQIEQSLGALQRVLDQLLASRPFPAKVTANGGPPKPSPAPQHVPTWPLWAGVCKVFSDFRGISHCSTELNMWLHVELSAAFPKSCAPFWHSCAGLWSTLAVVGRSLQSLLRLQRHLSPPQWSGLHGSARCGQSGSFQREREVSGGSHHQVPGRPAQSRQNRKRHDLLAAGRLKVP